MMEGLQTKALPCTVGEARSAVREALHQRGIPIDAEIDLTRNAFTELITVSAAVTFLFAPRREMARIQQTMPQLAPCLPLKLCLWQDAQSNNWLSYTHLPTVVAQCPPAAVAAAAEDIAALSALLEALVADLPQQG
ncbi:MAG: hypothetical protein PHN64_00420 [Desulfovibrionaceae bacterium]|nr:hypothetical protein [Desulfovibrionaceae bacterium]